MSKILLGKPVAESIQEDIKKRVAVLKEEGIEPKLGVIRVGANPGDISYERGILNNCGDLGIATEVFERDEDIDTEGLVELMEELNNDDSISGILMFRPLPGHIDEDALRNAIDPEKDVDCMSPINLARVFESDFSRLVPATPMAAMKVMEHYGIELEGKDVAVVNRSLVFGRPMAMMLLGANATPTICHSRTKDLEGVLKASDVAVVAIGRAESLGAEYFDENSVIIDVGVSAKEGGGIAGDANFDELEGKVKAISPVPGGVGAVTTSVLLEQVVKAAELNK